MTSLLSGWGNLATGIFFGILIGQSATWIGKLPSSLTLSNGEEGEMVLGPVPGGASFAKRHRSTDMPVVAYHHAGRYYQLRSVPPEVWEGTRRCIRLTVVYEVTDLWTAPWTKHISCQNGFNAEVRTTIHEISPYNLRSADPLLILPPRGEVGSGQGSPALPRPL